jgi:hypothetical protein
MLPRGTVRERYRLEHRGELNALSAHNQIRYASGALVTSWALRQALTEERDMSTTAIRPRKPLLCRLNIHHRWRVERSPGGEFYRRCQKCGKDDPGSYVERTVDVIGPGIGGGLGGGG